MKNQMEPEYSPQRKIHLYHCDHCGLPLALINANGEIAWSAEFDDGGICCVRITPTICNNLSGYQDSSMIKRRGCTITVTDTMTRSRDGILLRIR
ncbi:hypothetical protein GM31_05895 [Trabulsiella odontotermitis]|uniref:RHS protein conserved region domain-containing protein n=1 Tax=Trabulsiella odontotermitis TaxID=379893 RepID=A0A0L0GM47_9ENTR|nr:hypothetical protein GM31_05895 [Trabulsiella odontotermitis]KNC92605.1 hypothetical protein GM30_15485 [Trabulsiella odontotermitis]